MSEENKAAHRRLWEEFRGEGKEELADELLSDDYVGHDTNLPEDVPGIAGAKEQLQGYRTAFSDMKATVSDQEESGDEVTTSWNVTGTHDGDLMGIAPTGKSVDVSGKSRARFSDGKIAEEWHEWRQADMLGQLGVDPSQLQ